MAGKGIRPPPVSCSYLTDAIISKGARDLRDFSEQHPIAFNLLLEHSLDCAACSQLISEAFPDGFSTEEGKARLAEGLRRARAGADRTLAEEGSAEGASTSAEPRGGGAV